MVSNNLSGDSKVWIYQAKREFTIEEANEINILAQQFINGWNAHGQALNASFDLLYNRFIVLMVDENAAKASGCSIDSSVAFIKKIERQFNIDLMDRLNVAYIKNDKISITLLNEMQSLIDSKEIDFDTFVFNNLVATKTDFMQHWKTPIRNSWHAKMLKDQVAIS